MNEKGLGRRSEQSLDEGEINGMDGGKKKHVVVSDAHGQVEGC